MYEILSESKGNLIGVKLIGEVPKDEREEVISKLKSLGEEHGKIRLLIELHEFEAFGSETFAAYMEFLLPVVSIIEKFAFVGHSKLQEIAVEIDSFFAKMFGIKEEYFDYTKLDEAWNWLKED
ncbi:MAG: STAS/SEC14 domain-containing protein [Ignavibacteriae bacterium]|nr:STAS/SEC14 domain-containing protein [Ignavibacteriota bacterium]MCB9244681.1 STAS/SEC14 domain-containing protein [Ignavibacteriales bacterium]